MNEYIKQISSIPLLSEKETEDLIIAMKNGNKEARKKLIKHNLKLVAKISYKFQSRINLSIDDLISIGSLGLIKAIDNFDSSRGVKLTTVLYPYIENTFKSYICFCKKQKRDSSTDISLQEKIYESKDSDEITLEESIKDNGLTIEEIIIQQNRKDKIENILRKLTKEERELLFLRYGIIDGENRTLKEIAERKGLSGEAIRKREIIALKKLKHPNITKQIKDFFEE